MMYIQTACECLTFTDRNTKDHRLNQ